MQESAPKDRTYLQEYPHNQQTQIIFATPLKQEDKP